MILYRALMLAALPVVAVFAARRGGLRERMVCDPAPPRAIWIHGASNGELASARSVIEALAARGDDVLVTCNNPTAKAMVAAWGLAGVTVRLAPLDVWPVMRRMRRLRALVIVENELWPERILSARYPVLVIGARMSERSARRWGKVGLMRQMLGALSWVSAQDANSEARLVSLGLPPDRIGPRLTLKSAVPTDNTPLPAMPRGRGETLLAASTHAGEDAVILDAFTRQTRFRSLIIAPRHPARGAEVVALARARGLDVAQRSAGDPPSATVYVADTLGEMPLWYRAACATIIGGTFVPKGGHTPFEPAAYNSALIHGPDVTNFAEIFADLDRAGGALAAKADTLSDLLMTLDSDRMAQAAREALQHDDAAGVVLSALDAAISPDGPGTARFPTGRS